MCIGTEYPFNLFFNQEPVTLSRDFIGLVYLAVSILAMGNGFESDLWKLNKVLIVFIC